MNEIQIFNNAEFGEIRTVTDEQGNPWLALVDVCRVLGLENSRQVKTRLYTPGVITNDIGVQTGIKADGTPAMQNVKMTFINEQNFYKCIFQSRKPEAEKFSDWVTGEVLPAIRKTGGYGQADYSNLSPTLQCLIQMEQRQNALESRQNELESRMQATEQQIDKGLQNAYTEGYTAAHSVPFSLQKNFAEFVRRKARIICAKLPGGYERHGISITRNLYGRIRKEFHVQPYTELNLDQMEKAIDLVNDMTFERLVLKS